MGSCTKYPYPPLPQKGSEFFFFGGGKGNYLKVKKIKYMQLNWNIQTGLRGGGRLRKKSLR